MPDININFDINDIKDIVDQSTTYSRGFSYFNSGYVLNLIIAEQYAADTVFRANVRGESKIYRVKLSINEEVGINEYECNCPAYANYDGACKHIVAALLAVYYKYKSPIKSSEPVFSTTQKYEASSHELAYLVNDFERQHIISDDTITGSVEIIPEITELSAHIALEFKIGTDRKYILKNTFDFHQSMKNNTAYAYGKGLEFVHNSAAFTDASKPLANLIKNAMTELIDYKKIITHYNPTYEKDYRKLVLSSIYFDEFFDLYRGTSIKCNAYGYKNKEVELIDNNPYTVFNIIEKAEGLFLECNINDIKLFNGQTYTYLYADAKLYRCSQDFCKFVLPVIKSINTYKKGGLYLTGSNVAKFTALILPKLKTYAKVEKAEILEERYQVYPLKKSIYLDYDGSCIHAKTIFKYDDIQFNPFDKRLNPNVIRDFDAEKKYFALAQKYKILHSEDSDYEGYIDNEDDIYNFIAEGLNEFIKSCEVMVSSQFEALKIKQPRAFNVGVRLNAGLLSLDINDLEFQIDELAQIIKSFDLNQHYYRLRDGNFLNIDNEYIATISSLVDDFGMDKKNLQNGELQIHSYRALFLDSMLKNNQYINAKRDISFKNMIKEIRDSEESDYIIPPYLVNILRGYQKTGYNWLSALSKYHMGGILADDMGLGKTLQIITLLSSELPNDRPSIIISPASLVFNWRSEIARFSPGLRTISIVGTAEERKELINRVSEADVILTSYDLVKNDIDEYKKISFKYCIIDEAQYIKNHNTQKARAVKEIKSEIRYALTGTPVENSLSDLWSIFDFIMPGYLYSYTSFKKKFETPIAKGDINASTKFTRMISPFILRRLKVNVLKELPDKIESTVCAEFDRKEKGMYQALLAQTREEFRQELKLHGIDKSRIKILSLLTRLRQLCCHPVLVSDSYKGESAKLELCIELIKDSLEAGHRILLFSQFTSMLSIIEDRLIKEEISFFTLTGTTKTTKRLQLVEDFNSGDTQVFLISLKAGGTGLNLTGADVVIHYDPWWNSAVQNQATDRAHRIGQQNTVQVIKLICKDSIEERIYNLQQKKRDLSDAVIREGETFISKMSVEELDELFT